MGDNIVESQIHKDLYAFVKKETGFKITERTVFFKDLKLIGDDADAFMLRFCDTFEIGLDNFKFDEYFIEEYSIPFQYFFDRWFRKEKIRRKEFDLKHLEKIVMEKKWIDI